MRARGFTLIELLIVLAVIAVLATIALPSYNQYVMRAHRAHARAALLQLSQWMERSATVRGTYALAAEVPSGLLEVPGQSYRLEVASDTGMAYWLGAVPTGAQAADACGSFHLDHAGLRSQGATAQVTAPLGVQACWER